MKLQVNLNGSWRDVIKFRNHPLDLEVVAVLGRRLVALADNRCSMRIADDQGVSVEHLGESEPKA